MAVQKARFAVLPVVKAHTAPTVVER